MVAEDIPAEIMEILPQGISTFIGDVAEFQEPMVLARSVGKVLDAEQKVQDLVEVLDEVVVATRNASVHHGFDYLGPPSLRVIASVDQPADSGEAGVREAVVQHDPGERVDESLHTLRTPEPQRRVDLVIQHALDEVAALLAVFPDEMLSAETGVAGTAALRDDAEQIRLVGVGGQLAE